MKNVTFPNRHSRITRFVITAWLVYCSHNAHADFTSIPAAGGTAGVYGSLSGPISRQSASSTQDFSNHYFLYTAAELNAAGIQPGANLQSLKFHKAAGGYTVAPGNVLKIYMKNSNTLPGTIWCNPSFNTQINGATLVAQYNNFSVSPLQGWVMDINFSQAFIYTGGSIEIGISWNCSAYAGNPSSDGFSWTEQPISNQCFGARNSTAIMSMTLQSKRPIINFGFFNVCTVPAPGFAYGPTTVCPAQNFSLQIQFPITAYGLIYRWQRATDSQFTQQLYTFPPSPQSALSCSQDSGIWYYRCKANCTNAIMNSTVYSSTLQVNTAPKPTLQVSGINPSCASKNNGMLFCCGTGGTPPLVYSLNGTTPQANQLIGGLSSGTYTVQVNDAYACSAATEIILSSPDPLQISSVGTIAASNEQAYDGSVEFNMMGGTPPFQYSLDAGQNFQGNSSFTSLSAGNYQVTILDDNGCIHHGNVEVPYANFPWPTPEFELSVSPYHDTVAHLVWGFSGSLQYTLPEQWIVLRSTDSMHFTPVDSIQTFGLNDISSLPAGSYNEFGSILFSTEYNGVHRYIFNESLNNLQSNSRIYYRVLARFPLGGPSMYSPIIAFKPPFMQFAPFSPYDYTLSACPPIAPIPFGYIPT
ncbi:MAG TPA: hypothetical protein PLP14_05325, partial [Chitinophagaceae bacterium]|nr:hypothetical protein [Chitinophagaceae bacterium]